MQISQVESVEKLRGLEDAVFDASGAVDVTIEDIFSGVTLVLVISSGTAPPDADVVTALIGEVGIFGDK